MSFFDDKRPHGGLTHAEYIASWRASLARSPRGLDKDEKKRLYYVRYNFERQERVTEQFEPSPALIEAAQAINAPQLWMVLTEDWCGDSAYVVPVIASAAAAANEVELRFLRRDENLDIMDRYLTNGTRAIPKLVAFDMLGNELFDWGPRPAVLDALRREWKADGLTPGEMTRATIAWYDEGNWTEVEAELTRLLGTEAPALCT